MALVSYSDSDASDSEPETTPAPKTTPKPTPPTAAASAPKSTSTKNPPPSIVDRSNPRKIRVALPEIKPESTDDEPARKKPRTGGGGGAFSGFNSLLPAPKKNAAAEKKAPAARKPFSLKTGATPGFDRSADAEMRNDQAFDSLGGGGGDEDIPRAGSLREDEDKGGAGATSQGPGPDADGLNMKKPEEVKLKGNPMMFKPLSVGRTQPKKKKKPASPAPPAPAGDVVKGPPSAAAAQPASEQTPPVEAKPAAPQKPKVSLFSLGSSDTSSSAATTAAPSYQTYGTSYEPLVYSATPDAPAAGPAPATEAQSAAELSASSSAPQQTLDNIADDLNLSRAQRRHLFGRNADSAKSQVLHFNTDREYIANQELSHTDLAAQQHNPVRAIAPGKHSLQQLVNAASSQKEALEESFAAGKRNKQEAGSKYGWS